MEERYEVLKEKCETFMDKFVNLKIIDHKNNISLSCYDCCDLLNHQDKRINTLENIKAVEFVNSIKDYEGQITKLKESQKQLAINELEKLKDFMFKQVSLSSISEEITFVTWLCENYLDNQIKSLRGVKDESICC